VQVLHRTYHRELTLVTCYLFFYVGPAPKRFIVHARQQVARAVRGELVPREAELAKAEGRVYESAEQLLERIKAQRAGRSINRVEKTRRRAARTLIASSEQIYTATISSTARISGS